MGTEKKKRLRVVLDTNILVSALLFSGELSQLVQLWKDGAFIPIISQETFIEFRTMLAYPKFSLTKQETDTSIKEDVLPYFEVVEASIAVQSICRDPQDDKFLACAISASADLIVTGDKDLYDLKKFKTVRIIKASEFIRMFD